MTRSLRILGDPMRIRILKLLKNQELTVTELTEILNVGQSRVSGHLARMAEEGLVDARREGRFVYYLGTSDAGDAGLVGPVLDRFSGTEEDQVDSDALVRVLRQRTQAAPPGSLGKGYQPGRTWEGFAKALLATLPPLRVADLGIGSGEITLLLAETAERVIAVDRDAAVLDGARERARKAGLLGRVDFREGDLCAPPVAPGEVDLWVLSQVLHLVEDPRAALGAAAMGLSEGGRVLVLDLAGHHETWARDRLGHVQLGFSERELRSLLEDAGFEGVQVRRVSRDRKPPHFITLLATGRRPPDGNH